MRLSIILPTIPGREDELAKTVKRYSTLTKGVDIEWIVEMGYDNCGAAWNAGATAATGEILHFSADDLEPESSEWFPAMLGTLSEGGVPTGWVREDVDGTFGRDFCRVPSCMKEWWQPVPEIQYWSDNAFSDLMSHSCHPVTVTPGYDFYHRRSNVGRLDTPDRIDADHAAYLHQRQGPRT